jgi:hypothetical protein
MTTRLAFILTGIWTLIMTIGCGGVLWHIVKNVPRGQQEARASSLGSGCGVLASIGYGAIWLPWAAVKGKKRRQEREEKARQAAAEKRAKKKRKREPE